MKKICLFPFFLLFLFIRIEAQAQDYWTLLPFPDSLAITCLTVNQQGEIFVGTNTDTAYDGVFCSHDEGQTWEQVLDMGVHGAVSLTINKSGSIFVLGAEDQYLKKSIDNGLSWETLSLSNYGWNVKIISQGNDTLFVSQWASNGACLLKSVNGGIDWSMVFETVNHTSEYISDIAIAPNGDIYISLSCFFPDMGGVYKSFDGGITWEYVGLLNHQVRDVEVNAQGDLFFGAYFDFLEGGGGVYALYHDSTQISECFWGPMVYGLAINSAGDIYASTGFPDGITVSKDNGFNFNYENSGLPAFPMGPLETDSDDYIYSFFDGGFHYIYRSTDPTVGITENPVQTTIRRAQIKISPNPVSETLQGSFNDNIPDGNYSYTITDVTGRKMAGNRLLVSHNAFSVDISLLPVGYYTFNIACNDMIYLANIIKR